MENQRKTKQKKQNPKEKTPRPIFELTSRVTLFFFMILIVLIILYVAGNYQQFIDANQRLILYTSAIVSALLFLFATAGFVESIGLIIVTGKENFPWFYILLFFLTMIFSAAVLVILRVISFLSGGI